MNAPEATIRFEHLPPARLRRMAAADDVIAVLDRFRIDHAYPSWPTNR